MVIQTPTERSQQSSNTLKQLTVANPQCSKNYQLSVVYVLGAGLWREGVEVDPLLPLSGGPWCCQPGFVVRCSLAFGPGDGLHGPGRVRLHRQWWCRGASRNVTAQPLSWSCLDRVALLAQNRAIRGWGRQGSGPSTTSQVTPTCRKCHVHGLGNPVCVQPLWGCVPWFARDCTPSVSRWKSTLASPTRPGDRVYPHWHGTHTFCFWDTHRIHTLEPWDTHVIHANHEKKERNLGHLW